MRAATWFCMVPAYSVNKQASFRLKPNNRVKVHFCKKRLLSDYSKWLERKKEEEKGGISKERRKWRWDHHVYLSWQRFHTSSLNQRSIEQTGIDIPANVGRSFFLLKYFVCYSICWRMKDKNMWLFLFKRINFLSFFQRSFW